MDVGKAKILMSRKGKRGSNRARAMVMHILNRHSGYTQNEIGNSCGGLNRMAVSTEVRRFELVLGEDEELKLLHGRVLSALGIK